MKSPLFAISIISTAAGRAHFCASELFRWLEQRRQSGPICPVNAINRVGIYTGLNVSNERARNPTQDGALGIPEPRVPRRRIFKIEEASRRQGFEGWLFGAHRENTKQMSLIALVTASGKSADRPTPTPVRPREIMQLAYSSRASGSRSSRCYSSP